MKIFSAFFLIALAVTISFSQEQEKKTRFGIVTSLAIRLWGGEITIGATASIPIINTITFNPELNFVDRTYSGFIFSNYDEINEFAVSIPLLLQGMPFGGPWFYIEYGILFAIPFATEISEKSIYKKYTRESVDVGAVGGFGWHIGKHITFNFRCVLGSSMVTVRSLDYGHTLETTKLSSLGLGLGYLF